VLVALGTFDGFHRGHKEVLLSDKTEYGKKIALMFSEHPQKTLSGETPGELITPQKRDALLKEWGFEPVFIDFCEISELSPREFFEEILMPGTEYHGSLESTLASYIAFVKFVGFCKEHSFKIQNDNGNIERKANELLESIKSYFIRGNKVTLNVPVREKSIKKKRFAYGDCDMCRENLTHVYYGELELAEGGIYMCPKCFSSSYAERFEPTLSYTPQASALLCAEPLMADSLGKKNMKKLLESAVKERQNDMFVRTVRSDTLFLEAVKYYDLKEYEILFKNFIRADLENSAYPHTVCESQAKGKFSTQTMARVITAFI
jgi:phosphopantetheine adenylyltransferase